MTHIIPKGTTEPQDFVLRDNGAAINGTGLTVAVEMYTRTDGVEAAVSPAPTAAWLSQATGTVRVTGVGALDAANYYVRFKVTDGSGNIGYFPNREKADVWRVVAVGAS